MAKLDDAQLRAEVVTAVVTGMTTAQAGSHVGLSRQSILAYSKRHPEFQLELETARCQRDVVVRRAPGQTREAALATPELREPGGSPLDMRNREDFFELLNLHANDAESRGCAKALGIAAEYHLGAELRAKARLAERDADATAGPGAPILEIVRFEPGPLEPGPLEPEPTVVDVEVIEP